MMRQITVLVKSRRFLWAVAAIVIFVFAVTAAIRAGQQWLETLMKGLPPEHAGSEHYIIDIVELLDLGRNNFYMEPKSRIEDREDLVSGGYPVRESATNTTASTDDRLAFFLQSASKYTDNASAVSQFGYFKTRMFYVLQSEQHWQEITDSRLLELRSSQHFVACRPTIIDTAGDSNVRCSALLQTESRIWYVNNWRVRGNKEYLTQDQFVRAVIAADARLQQDLTNPPQNQ